jgi:uncharacterized iron-regulated membrane protein
MSPFLKGAAMDPILILVLVLAVLAIAGSGYGYWAARPAPAAVVAEPAPGPSPLFSFLGVVGLILLVAFVVLLLTGWRFGLEIVPPR